MGYVAHKLLPITVANLSGLDCEFFSLCKFLHLLGETCHIGCYLAGFKGGGIKQAHLLINLFDVFVDEFFEPILNDQKGKAKARYTIQEELKWSLNREIDEP